MNERCLKCGRKHSGICGIPKIIHLNQNTQSRRMNTKTAHEKPESKTTLGIGTLEKLLEEGKKQYDRIMELLKTFTAGTDEYDQLIEKESQLKHVIEQIIGQIAARR